MHKHAVTFHALQCVIASLAVVALSSGANACTLAFEKVTVVAMTFAAVVPDQTVVVDGQRIIAVNSAPPPAGACHDVIDGRGKFLAPGLVDSHIHVESRSFAAVLGQEPDVIDFDAVLALYPAYGITSVRVMSGAPDILQFRDQPPSAKPAPRLIVASPMLAGRPPILPEPITIVVETPEAARAIVSRLAGEGYDLIKVRENLSPAVLHAVVAAASALRLDVDGHVTRGLGIDALLAAGQRGLAHLDEVARAVAAGTTSTASLKRHRAHVSSAMIVLKNAIEQMADYDGLTRRPDVRFLHPMLTTSFWSRAANPYLRPGVDRAFFESLLTQTQVTLRSLNTEGVMVVAGSDALNPMIIPGASLHEELQLMVDAGLTPYQAIRTATVHPSKVIARLANAGVVAPGRDADLVLLSANPLHNIDAYRRPAGIVLRGRWFDRDALDRRLEEVAATFHPEH